MNNLIEEPSTEQEVEFYVLRDNQTNSLVYANYAVRAFTTPKGAMACRRNTFGNRLKIRELETVEEREAYRRERCSILKFTLSGGEDTGL